MKIFRMVIAKSLPEASESGEPAGQPMDEEERGKWAWWKLKKWSLQILCRFYTRYCRPKKAEGRVPADDCVSQPNCLQLLPNVLPFCSNILNTFAATDDKKDCICIQNNAALHAVFFRWTVC